MEEMTINVGASEQQPEVTPPTDREIVMTRVFDASRERVFDAFTKPEIVKQWLLAPDGWSLAVCEIDLRVGGAFRYVWRNGADGQEFVVSGVYTEITRAARVVHTNDSTIPRVRANHSRRGPSTSGTVQLRLRRRYRTAPSTRTTGLSNPGWSKETRPATIA
jgi:uncharacterized protein YndB with AHSA1/START domain